MAEVVGGYQPDTKSASARRADFDLRRRVKDLEAQVTALQSTVTAITTIPSFITVTAFVNSWHALGGSRAPTSYRRRGDLVDLRVSTAGGTNNIAMFSIPAAYRPLYTADLVGRDGNGGHALINVQAGGEVHIFLSNAAYNTAVAGVWTYSVSA